MTRLEFEAQVQQIQISQPGLSGCESSDGFQITGTFVLNHVANDIPLYEEYLLTVKIPNDFPTGFPMVWETSGLIPEGFDHVYPDKHLCLAANCEIASLLDRDPSLLTFIEELVTSYLYSATYYGKYKVYPFGERQHGTPGLKEAYAERYHADSDDTLCFFLGYVSGVLPYRGHASCPCHSGRRLRECHGEVILRDLQSPRYSLFRNETSHILYDMLNERRQKMATKVPQKAAFKIAGNYQVYLTRCELGACFFSVISTALSFFEFYAYIKDMVTVISVAFLIAICFFQMRFHSTYREAESVRRDGLIDHCFGTIMADTKSEGYYDSVDIDSGFKKLLASIHESSLLSSGIIDGMLKRQERITFIGGVFVIIACVARSIQSELFLAILNGFLSLRLISDYGELRSLRAEIRTVLDNCKHICEDFASSHRKTFSTQQQAHLLREAMRYECALAYASIMFDEDIYQHLNPAHEKEWSEIKRRYYR